MNILITGITGFVGSHLAEYLLSLGHNVYGLARWRSDKSNLKNVIDRVTLLEGDLCDLPSLITVFKHIGINQVYHLAAKSFVQSSYSSPIDTLNTNIIGTCNLLETIRLKSEQVRPGQYRKFGFPKILMCSSSEVYGNVEKEDTPTKETQQLRPLSPYAVSKASADLLCYQYFKTYNIPIIRTRAFTHTGERRGDVFFASSFAKQIVAIELGLNDKFIIRCGDLGSVRTICDVKDMVRGYWLALKEGIPGEVYNIGGDKQYGVGKILFNLMNRMLCEFVITTNSIKECIESINSSGEAFTCFYEKRIKIKQDPELMRPSDVSLQIPDTTKFRECTGWKPEIGIDKTLDSLLNYWRNELKINPWKAKIN